MKNIWLALITGLTTGGISCFSVQGGLLASSLVQGPTDSPLPKKWQGVTLFTVSKLLAYTLLGFLLGGLGARIAITPQVQGFMQIFAGLFMLVTAARLLDVHPIFRSFQIKPPKFAYKLSKNLSHNPSLFAPFFLGFSTILLPCGITQAMMVLAVTSGNPFWGAAIMFAFTLGTSPVFFLLGMAAAEIFKRKFLKLAASLIIVALGIISINTGQVLRGSPHTLGNYFQAIFSFREKSVQAAAVGSDGFQEVTINVKDFGYQTNIQDLKMGIPVRLHLVTDNTKGCSRAFTIPQYNISEVLPQTGKVTVEFTPQKTGRLTYTCSMGMYNGSFNITP